MQKLVSAITSYFMHRFTHNLNLGWVSTWMTLTYILPTVPNRNEWKLCQFLHVLHMSTNMGKESTGLALLHQWMPQFCWTWWIVWLSQVYYLVHWLAHIGIPKWWRRRRPHRLSHIDPTGPPAQPDWFGTSPPVLLDWGMAIPYQN